MLSLNVSLLTLIPMNDYVGALASTLSSRVEVNLFAPERYTGLVGECHVTRFPTGKNKLEALKYFLNPWAAWKLWNKVIKIKPDVIHIVTGEGYPWTVLFLRWANQAGIPVVITVHDPEPHPGGYVDIINSFLRKYTLRRATRVHIHSKRFIPHISKLGVSSDLIEVIPHGSIAKIYLDKKHTDVPKENSVLFFGRFEPYKGIEDLVKVALKMSGQFRFIIAGPGRLPNKLEKVIRSRPDLFEFYNHWLSEAEVSHLFQRASVCLLPYKQATQSSLPLISAAFNVPVVASAVGALIDDVPLVGGLLVSSGDVDGFVDAIQKSIGRTPYYPASYEYDVLMDDFIRLYEIAIAINTKLEFTQFV